MTLLKTEKTTCDLCNSKNLEELYTTRMCLDSTKNIWENIYFVICKDCGLVFENPRMSLQSMKSYYSNEVSSNVNYGIESNGELARKEQFEFTKKFIKKSGTMLDIGARDNSFIKYWQDQNYKIIALEPGPSFKTELSEITFIPKFYEDYKPDKKFDIICMRHVLEHTFSPIDFLNKSWNDLKDDGLLFIEVPNLHNPWITFVDFFVYYHTFNFSPVTINSYVKKSGFEVLDSLYEIPYNAMRIIARKTKKNSNSVIQNDYRETKNKFLEYKDKRKNFLKKIKDKILNIKGNKIGIFGAGDHSMHLINSINLDLTKIACFFDSSKNKQNTKFFGLPVLPPTIIKEKKFDTIIISSYDYQEEMNEIIKKIDPNVEVIRFYDVVVAYDTYNKSIT